MQAGQTVARDQVLVRVESPEVNSRLAQERSALLSAQSDLQRQRILARQDKLQRQQAVALLGVQLEAAKRAMDRAERTKQMGILNDVDYEKAQDEVKLADMRFTSAKQEAGLAGETLAFEVTNRESQVEQQRLVVSELERQVDALAVKAPFAGLVSRVAVADRDSVTEGQPLVGVVDLSRLEIEVWVPESYAPDIKPGTPAVITIDARQLQGEVTSLSPEVQGSRVRGVVGFSGATPAGLKQNQRVSAKLVLETRRDVLKVARGPFLEALGERGAYVVDDDRAELRPIEVGSVSVSEVEIASGLKEGDQIVLSDPHYWGGMRNVQYLAHMTGVLGMGLSMHSNSHLGISMAAHFGIGAARSIFTGRGVWVSGRDMFVVGFGVAGIGYLIGEWLPRLLS